MTRAEAAKACPLATAFIAAMRKEFGAIEVRCVQENGHQFGTPPAHWAAVKPA